MEQPWFTAWYANAEKRLLNNDLDVLALQEVWTAEARNRILAIPGLKRKFPHHYFVPADNSQTIGCNFANDQQLFELAYYWITLVQASGTNTQQIQQPLTPMSAQAYEYALYLALYGYNPVTGLQCLACLINSLQYLPEGPPAFGALQQCGAYLGPKNGHQGENGQLILSRYPIQDVHVTKFDSFLINRANIHATIRGFKLSFGHFAFNLIEDIYPESGGNMTGALQPQMAADMIVQNSDAVLGDFNSGHNYQSAGFDTFIAAGYASGFKSPEPDTWCRQPSHQGFLPCLLSGVPPSHADAIDHILHRKNSRVSIHHAKLFNDLPADASDHTGVKAELRRWLWGKTD
jgi:endonuclease/exonuclease/phosphatase family metal-dependent hydrolase